MMHKSLRMLSIVPAALLCGCSGMTNTDKGVLAGGGLGALAGGLIGGATGNAVPGAIIGAGLGGVAGGLTGAGIDEAERKAEARAVCAANAVGPRLGLTDIVTMVQQGVSDDVIITQIRTSGSVFYLSASDLGYLKNDCGVSDRVVMEMQATANRCRLYRTVPVYGPPPPVYVVEPPPVGVGVGFSYTHCR